MKKKLVSVIVPMYNSENYICKTIESVLSQTYDNFELILINDGSLDKTLLNANKYKGLSNVKIINIENHGVSYARNIGLDNASGDYVTFLDSDDTLLPNAIESMLILIEKYNADICVTKIKRVAIDGSIISKPEDFKIRKYGSEESLIHFLKNDGLFEAYSANAKLYKASLIKNIRFRVGKKSNEDRYYFFESLMEANEIVCDDVYTYVYQKRNNSLSTSKNDYRIIDNLFFADLICEKVIDKEDLLYYAKLNQVKTYLYVYRNLLRNNSLNNVKILKIKEQLKKIYEENIKYDFLTQLELFFACKMSYLYKLIVIIKNLVNESKM